MARPTKSARLLTDKSQTKDEINARIAEEDKLGGGKDAIVPPEWLSDVQKIIFESVVDAFAAADVLRNLDVHILAEFAWSLDCKCRAQAMINSDPDMLLNGQALNALKRYQDVFFRCCNELSLSPQSRAKLANVNAQVANNDLDMIKKIISGDIGEEEEE